MASEITFNMTLSITKGTFKVTETPGAIVIDMAGDGGGNPGLYSIPAADTALTVGTGIGTEGVATFQNLDDTNFVDFGNGAGAIVPFIRCKPGEIWAMRLTPGQTLRGLADTAACECIIKIYED